MNRMLVAAALLGQSTAVGSAAKSGSPVERIVKLLSELKQKTVDDGKHEQQIYDKYACWCETTSKRKADDIDQARADMRSLGQRILKLKGTVATRTSEIQELTENIEANENQQSSLTAVRGKQNAEWQAASDEVKQALTALQSAITVLADATTPKGASAFMQESAQAKLKYALTNVMDKLPSRVGLPPARMAELQEIMSSQSNYAPQSATIQGMLGDMYLTFAANLESDTSEEATQNQEYEEQTATLEKTNNELKAERARKEEEKAEAEAMLADTTKAYEDTEKQMNADIEFFGETKKACLSKHEEWELRTKMRDEELDGITKALDILTGDKARELFANAIQPGVGFLQISQDTNAPEFRAYNAVKAEVKKSHSVRLAALAVKIRSAKVGHFDKVIGAIDDMLKTLEEEGAADIAKRDQCKDEYQHIAKTVNDLDWKIKNNEAKIAKLEKLIELRTEEKQETIQKIKDTKAYIKDIKAERKAEHEAYQQAKKDDENAVALLEEAKAAFSKFMKEHVELLQEPEFARSADDAPDATFSDKGNNKGKSKGVLALFEYIIEDLNDELKNEKKSEMNSQAEFEEELATAEKLVDDLTQKKTTLTEIIAKRNDDKEAETETMGENNDDRDAELKYQAKIKPDCDWILKSFEQRAAARAAEANGLTTAKEFLAGKTALIQEAKFDDAKLSNIKFLGMSK